MKAVLTTRGSRGDVYPIIEIATALKTAGHSVSLCVPRLFDQHAKNRGLEPSLYSEDSELVMQQLKSGLQAIQTALDWFSRSIDEQFDFMLRETFHADVLITSVNEVAGPTVAEYRAIPHFRIAYTPVLPGYQPPPLIPWQRLPGMANRRLWDVINGFTGLMIKKHINRKRAELGLEPMGGINDYFTSKSHTVLTLNPVLAPPCHTWFDNYDYSYTGYCYGPIDGSLDPDLIRFLDAGPRPVYIGFGSVNVKDSDAFTRLILEAVKRTRCRVVLGSGWTGLGKTDLPGNIFPVGDTNHASLFQRCAGIAHHGGCGTTHTAARAGVPQFIMPQIADQFYWGHRIYKLGLGPAPVPPRTISVRRLAKTLDELTNNQWYALNAKALGDDMQDENGIPGTVDIISRIMNDGRQASSVIHTERQSISSL